MVIVIVDGKGTLFNKAGELGTFLEILNMEGFWNKIMMHSPLGAGKRPVELMFYIRGSQILRVSDQLENFLKHRLLWAPLSEFLTLVNNMGWKPRELHFLQVPKMLLVYGPQFEYQCSM